MKRSELVSLLSTPKCQAVTIIAKTEVKLEKSALLEGVTKTARVNGLIGWRYESSVNRQREREGLEKDFVAEDRRWGQRIDSSPWVEHKGEYYLEVMVRASVQYEYRDALGKLVDPDVIHALTPKRKEGERQGVERPVMLRDYALRNILSIRVDGQEHFLEN